MDNIAILFLKTQKIEKKEIFNEEIVSVKKIKLQNIYSSGVKASLIKYLHIVVVDAS
jgi:hypothetical protein